MSWELLERLMSQKQLCSAVAFQWTKEKASRGRERGFTFDESQVQVEEKQKRKKSVSKTKTNGMKCKWERELEATEIERNLGRDVDQLQVVHVCLVCGVSFLLFTLNSSFDLGLADAAAQTIVGFCSWEIDLVNVSFHSCSHSLPLPLSLSLSLSLSILFSFSSVFCIWPRESPKGFQCRARKKIKKTRLLVLFCWTVTQVFSMCSSWLCQNTTVCCVGVRV